jgi:hypothetical protein
MGPRGRGPKSRVGEVMTLPLAAGLVSPGRNGAGPGVLRRQVRVRAPTSGGRSTSGVGTQPSDRRQANLAVHPGEIRPEAGGLFREGALTAGLVVPRAGIGVRSGPEHLERTSTECQEEPGTGVQARMAVTLLAASVLMAATAGMAATAAVVATVLLAATGLMGAQPTTDRSAGRTQLVHGCGPPGQTGKCRPTGAALPGEARAL